MGRSRCPRCGATITWSDNIPLLSYLLLKGRCRYCRKPISLRYPLMEASGAVLFWGAYRTFADCSSSWGAICTYKGSLGPLALPFVLFVFGVSVAIFVIDFEKRIIPDELVFTGLISVLIVLVFVSPGLLYINLTAAFLAAAFLLFIHLATKGRGMGLGDVKYALFAGAFLGPPWVIVWLFLAFLTGGIVGIILVLSRKKALKSQIAFGPFLVFSFFVTVFFGENILKWFLGL